MDLQIDGRVALVTGATTGIGRATALMLARAGAKLAVAGRNVAVLDDLAADIVRDGGTQPLVLTGDLARPETAGTLADRALDAFGRVDILVNNAGGSRPLAALDDETAWEEAFALNFDAARRLTHRLAPLMAGHGWGRVVNVSGAVIIKAVNAASPAKAALESWSKSMAARFAAEGVTVNCVAPGRIKSPQIMERLHPTEAARAAFIAQNIPAGRFGEPDEAAAVIAFLASGPASYVNGVTIPVDGGALRLAF
ncbi:SDR family NAD(P)-dependent oxidoreductase [Prosthecodimorpha staleyi]|uniref:SDR family oxidoreductase n=1 Tax=Prosthecodimorpha staleyi TaxID=2840188 RepID=A0A947D021_9HYPH|nr:SDR family oxidoreductase [Prosthecodimorpha staleyi]MBT9288450.1 SDR family oxidoreductase [Prosthecodimorpha staleyi]